jgi:hypothetical protein
MQFFIFEKAIKELVLDKYDALIDDHLAFVLPLLG